MSLSPSAVSNVIDPAAQKGSQNPSQKPPQKLFVPGPTDVHPDVLAAQNQPMIGHRSKEFEHVYAHCEALMKALFFTENRVYMVAASGSGMQEAAIRNAVQNRVINFVNGAFSQRFNQVSEGCGKEAIRVDLPWCTAVKPEQVVSALEEAMQDGPVDAITVVHNETSTGVTSPVGEIAAAVRKISPDTLILVDAVSSFSGTKIPFDEWGLDLCLTSSQKALALPPGLAFAAVSDRLLARAKDVSGRGWYFDFLNLEKYLLRSTTPATPAISLMWALNVQLDRIAAEGFETRFHRHHELAQRAQEWAVSRGMGLMAEEGYRSPTVTTVDNTHDLDIAEMNAFLKERGMQVANGYGPYKGKAFRIGHMGEVLHSDLDRLFAALDDYLSKQGVSW